MKKADKAYRICHIALCILYFPLSLFSWGMMMVSESTIDVTDKLYVMLIDIFCVVSFLIPFLCIGGLLLSRFLKKKDHKWAFGVQFIPLAVFILNLLFIGIVAQPESTGTTTVAVTEEVQPQSNKLTVGISKSHMVTDYFDNYYTAYLEQQTGLELDFFYFSGSSYAAHEPMLLTMAEHDAELPDIIMDLDLARENYGKLGKDGVFLDLAPYFDDRAKSGTWWERFEQLPEEQQRAVWDTVTCDGAVYGFPTVYNSPSMTMDYQVYINRQWLEKLNLDMPTDPDSLYKVLKAFKGVDFNGNGKEDEIPLLGTADNSGGDVFTWIINMFLYYDDQAVTHLDENGVAYEPATTDAYRDALRYIRKLYAEELLSPLSFSCNNTDLQRIIENGVGIVCGDAMECFEANSEKMADYEALPLWGCGVRNPGRYHVSTYITRDCKNVEAAWSLLMAMSTEKAALIQRYGEEDVCWNKTDRGLRIYGDTWTTTGNDNWRTIEATVYTELRWELLPSDLDVYDRYTLVDEMWKSYEAREDNPTRTYDPWGQSELVKLRWTHLMRFTTGRWDIEDDARWQYAVSELQELISK